MELLSYLENLNIYIPNELNHETRLSTIDMFW